MLVAQLVPGEGRGIAVGMGELGDGGQCLPHGAPAAHAEAGQVDGGRVAIRSGLSPQVERRAG